jgi:hypothetical protein
VSNEVQVRFFGEMSVQVGRARREPIPIRRIGNELTSTVLAQIGSEDIAMVA